MVGIAARMEWHILNGKRHREENIICLFRLTWGGTVKIIQSSLDKGSATLAANSVTTEYVSINGGYPSGYTYVGHNRAYANGLIVQAEPDRDSTQTNPNTIPVTITNATSAARAIGNIIIRSVYVKSNIVE